jgi:hypothetical protein
MIEQKEILHDELDELISKTSSIKYEIEIQDKKKKDLNNEIIEFLLEKDKLINENKKLKDENKKLKDKKQDLENKVKKEKEIFKQELKSKIKI